MTTADSHPRLVLGLWPIAGITTVGVTPQEAEATIAAAIDAGITAFDTAFSYGFDGESDRLLGRLVRRERDRFRIIGKVGQRWDADRRRVVDASPPTLLRDAETSLRRMGIDSFDLLLLHAPDPHVPLEASAQAMSDLVRRGWCRATGVCNVTPSQYQTFRQAFGHLASDGGAIQCPLNLLQRDSLGELIPLADSDGWHVYVYWTLMKGLLAGKIGRDHQFAAGDSRPGYAIFQGAARRRAHDILDALTPLARSAGKSIAQLSIGWAVSQPGVTAALVGARRVAQVIEIAGATELPAELVAEMDRIVDRYS